MHSIGIRLAKLGEPVGKVLIVGAEAENVVFAVGLDVDVPHIGVVDIQATFFHARVSTRVMRAMGWLIIRACWQSTF